MQNLIFLNKFTQITCAINRTNFIDDLSLSLFKKLLYYILLLRKIYKYKQKYLLYAVLLLKSNLFYKSTYSYFLAIVCLKFSHFWWRRVGNVVPFISLSTTYDGKVYKNYLYSTLVH